MPSSFCLWFAITSFLLPKMAFANPPIQFEHQNQQNRMLFPEEGSRLTLKCPVQNGRNYGSSTVQFRWYRDGQPLGRHSPTLSIPTLSRTDSGLYRCYAFSSDPQLGGAFSPAVNISVQFLDGFADEEAENFFHPKFVPNVSFWLRAPRLNAGGHSADLHWKWSKEGRGPLEQLQSDGITHFVSANGDLLVLDPDGEMVEGKYSVEVSDGKKAFSSKIYHLLQKDANANSLAEVPTPTFKIVQGPEDATVLLGESEQPNGHGVVHFDCVPNFGRKYEEEIRWWLNGEEVPNTPGLVRMELGGRRLVVDNLGQMLGKGIRSAVVLCEAKAKMPEGTSAAFRDQADARLDILEIPHINRDELGEEVVKEEGDSLELVCRTDRGWPRPKLMSWYFNEAKIDGATSEQLVISKLNGQQFGVYQCEAMNSAGSDIAPVWVKKRESGDGGGGDEAHSSTNPNGTGGNLIEEGPHNQSHLIGSNVQMSCRLRRTHNGAVVRPVWSRNNEEIPSGGDLFRRISIDAEGTLWISQVGPDNIGQYRCTAKGGGEGEEESQQTGWLAIIEKPGMVENVRAELVNESNGRGQHQERIRVHWNPGFDGNSPVWTKNLAINPHFHIPPFLVSKWVLEMRTKGPTGYWSDWEQSMEVFSHQNGATTLEECCSAFVETNVRPAATAEFRVMAHNRFGAGKPSLPSQPITMPQQPPAAAPSTVHASARSAQSLLVQWQSSVKQGGPEGGGGEDGIRGYLVRYRLSGYSTAEWNERNISDGQARNALIEPLITWREYDVQVAAYNDRGLGVFSRPVSASTLEGAPMQAPQNVQVKVVNSTAIEVDFDPPNPQMVPGVNLGYKVQLWSKGQSVGVGEPAQMERLLPATGRIRQQIAGLTKFGLYNLTVLCFTAPGDGPRSEPLEFRTAEDLPGPVQSMEAVEVFSESALVQWERPIEANGDIQKYTLEWWEVDGERRGRVEISGHRQNYTLEGLKAETKYKVAMQAFTRIGAGPSVEATFESGIPPELPGRPSALSISEVGARKARLHFVAGSDGHAQIKKWLVEARVGPSSSPIFSPLAQFSTFPRGINSLLIDSLRPHTEYQLRLIAENVRGRSPPSDPSPPFRTQQSAPEHPPHRLWADPVSAGQISVVWTPLVGWEWNGDEPRAYSLQYRGEGMANLRGQRGEGNGTMVAEAMGKVPPELDHINWDELRILGAHQHQHLLTGLRPFCLYQLRILAQNGVGRSEPGPIVLVQTYEGVPSAAPPLHAELTAQGGIEAGWEQLGPELANGQISGYKITLLETNEREEEVVAQREIGAGERRSIHFPSTMLRPNAAYSIVVQAQTIIGPGPKQEKGGKVVKTPEDVPDAPSNASFVYKSPSELRLGWSHPWRPKGRILHYGVLYWRHGDPRPAIPFTEIPPNLAKFSATHLRPNSTYLFALKAHSSAGWGSERVLRVSTSRNTVPLPLPPVPSRDTSMAQSAAELHVRWDRPPNDGGDHHSPPRSIELQWQGANQDGWSGLPEYIPIEANSHTLGRLRPNSAYRVRIRFIGDLSFSAWCSPSDWLRTMEAAPSRAPTDVQLESVDPTTLRVRWQPLPRQEWNAERIGYRILYRIYQPMTAFASVDSSNASNGRVEEVPSSESVDEMEVLLKGLQSFRRYLVQVHAYNVLGQSAPSRPPRFIFMGHSKLKKHVHNLRAEAISSTSIRVQWDPLEEGNAENESSGYRLRWHLAGGPTDHSDEEMTLTGHAEHILMDLRKWSEYRIAVSGYNRAGEGPLAKVTARTLQDLPGPVGPIQFRDILLDSLRVFWSAPSEINGNLTGFVLLYRTSRQRNNDDEQQQHGRPIGLGEIFPKKEVQMRTEKMELLLDQLEENITYFVSVRAETAAGLGPERTAEVGTGFNPGAPEAPPGRPQLIPEQRHVRIGWTNGAEGANGPIVGHLVQAKRVGTSGTASMLTVMDEGRSLAPLPAQEGHQKRPRHLIGHWSNVGMINSGPNTREWRIPYGELEPSSFYVFRLFARNELGIGWPSGVSEQLHVPASIPEEPFYTEWWFLALIGALLAIIIAGFMVLLLLMGKRRGKEEEIGEKRKRKRKKGPTGTENAFDTLQLSDGGIVSYELYTKRSQGGDELLVSRPNTKQSWVGSIRDNNNSPAISSSRSAAVTGIYGSIDGGERPKTGQNGDGGGGGGGGQVPNMYTALCTDSMPMLLAEGPEMARNGRSTTHTTPSLLYTSWGEHCGATKNGQTGDHYSSPPYYQLRQFNAASRLGHPPGGIYYGGGGGGPSHYGSNEQIVGQADNGGAGLPAAGLPLAPIGGFHDNQTEMGGGGDGGNTLFVGSQHEQSQQPSESQANWHRTRERAQQQPRELPLRTRTPMGLFGKEQQEEEGEGGGGGRGRQHSHHPSEQDEEEEGGEEETDFGWCAPMDDHHHRHHPYAPATSSSFLPPAPSATFFNALPSAFGAGQLPMANQSRPRSSNERQLTGLSSFV